MRDMTHYSNICALWRIQMWYMTHPYVWHASFVCTTWRFHMCDTLHLCVCVCVRTRHVARVCTHTHEWRARLHHCWRFVSFPQHNVSASVTGRSHMGDMTHSYVWWHDAFICVRRRIHMGGIFHSYLWQVTFICVPHDYSYMRHDPFISATWLIHMVYCVAQVAQGSELMRVTWLIHMCSTHDQYVWRDLFKCFVWRRGGAKTNSLAWWWRIHMCDWLTHTLRFLTYVMSCGAGHILWVSHVTGHMFICEYVMCIRGCHTSCVIFLCHIVTCHVSMSHSHMSRYESKKHHMMFLCAGGATHSSHRNITWKHHTWRVTMWHRNIMWCFSDS